MTAKDFANRLRAAVRLIQDGLPTEVEARAKLDLIALVKDRVVQRGLDKDGQRFSSYSTKKVPAFLYRGRSRSQGAEERVTALGKKGVMLSYKDFREVNNLNSSFKNFEFTGEMWRSINVLETRSTKNQVTVIIGADNQEAADKLQFNSETENVNIIEPSKEEIEVVRKNLEKWLSNILKKSIE